MYQKTGECLRIQFPGWLWRVGPRDRLAPRVFTSCGTGQREEALGLAAARDAIIDELGDVAQAMQALDQSYTITFPPLVIVHDPAVSSATDSAFTDAMFYSDCFRSTTPFGQASQSDGTDNVVNEGAGT